MTNTIFDIHDRNNPAPWWRRRRSPSALELAVVALEECRRDRLDHAQKAEYHTAMLKMLEQRDKRLQEDIKRLSEEVRIPRLLTPTKPPTREEFLRETGSVAGVFMPKAPEEGRIP